MHVDEKPVLISDLRNGWGVTAVDALSTAIVVEDKRVVKQILDHIAKVDFTTTEVEDESISVFETNIRYLGGMISGTCPADRTHVYSTNTNRLRSPQRPV